jgi:hypothetical protein
MAVIGAHTLYLKPNLIWVVKLLALTHVEMDSTTQEKHVILDMGLVAMERLTLVVHLHALLVVATHVHGLALHQQVQAHVLLSSVEMGSTIQGKHVT